MSNPWPGANAWVVMVVRLLEIRTVNGCFVNGAFATQLNQHLVLHAFHQLQNFRNLSLHLP